ncbi:MAG: hypothetical protein CME72_10965 [Halomonadaceae bacterium]|nr:hypothetical protein [Halomonadaceae bacterium]
MAEHTASPRMTLHPHSPRVRALAGDPLIANTFNAIELRERGYPQRPGLKEELPRADVDMSKLSVSVTMAFYPFKGGATYCSFPDIANVAWSDERPIDEMQAISCRLAFDAK